MKRFTVLPATAVAALFLTGSDTASPSAASSGVAADRSSVDARFAH
ncbi:hypothetical protein [Crystallibacter degradans]|nr:hypothetical protein [Arthrobacter sp. SF27]